VSEVGSYKMEVADQLGADDDGVNAITSPCISVCFLDENDVCLGCYRSAQEITDWSVFSNQQKKVVMDGVKKRHRAMNKHLLL
jgi:predicted Fe-S protein YdhL (DUF1289 family)